MFKGNFLFSLIIVFLLSCSPVSDSYYYFYSFDDFDGYVEDASIIVRDHFGQQQLSILPLIIGVKKHGDIFNIYYSGSIFKNIESSSVENLDVSSYSNYFSLEVLPGNFYSLTITNSKDVFQKYRIENSFSEENKIEIHNSVILSDITRTGEIFVSSNKVYPIVLKKK